MKLANCFFLAFLVVALFSCNNAGKTENETAELDTLGVSEVDTTYYGVCGEGTMMSTLELVRDNAETLSVLIDTEMGSDVQGGLLPGDKMAVTCCKMGEDVVAQKVINLTTLLGRWTSLDRNFTIKEDGHVESNVAAESRPYTVWNIVNAKLVLNADTFDVVALGADSLLLENRDGIFAYKRQK